MATFTMKQMTVDHFIKNYKDAPIQRLTSRHAKKYSKKHGHLHEHHPAHLLVAVAEGPNAQKWRIDGHSRALLWSEGRLELPPGEKLWCQVWSVKDVQEACEIYLTTDNMGASENSTNLTEGALRFLHFTPQHPAMIRETGVLSAVKFWLLESKYGQGSHINHVSLLTPWVTALTQLDSMEKFYNATRFPSVVMAAALATFRRDGLEAINFWQDYHNDAGTKGKSTMNGVEMANEVLMDFKNPVDLPSKRAMRNRKGRAYNNYTMKLLHCYDQYMDNKRFAISVGQGNRRWKDAMTCRDWWLHNFDGYDHPDIFIEQSELELPNAKT